MSTSEGAFREEKEGRNVIKMQSLKQANTKNE